MKIYWKQSSVSFASVSNIGVAENDRETKKSPPKENMRFPKNTQEETKNL